MCCRLSPCRWRLMWLLWLIILWWRCRRRCLMLPLSATELIKCLSTTHIWILTATIFTMKTSQIFSWQTCYLTLDSWQYLWAIINWSAISGMIIGRVAKIYAKKKKPNLIRLYKFVYVCVCICALCVFLCGFTSKKNCFENTYFVPLISGMIVKATRSMISHMRKLVAAW